MAAAIKAVGVLDLERRDDLYLALMRSIVGQQLSVKAARTIWERFLSLFETAYPSAQTLLDLPVERLRAVGLSFQKAGYLQNIARFSVENTLDYNRLEGLNDEELIVYLTKIKGVGRWTVEMILMFNLARPDVFPKDDLGIQNGIRLLYGVRTADRKQLYRKMDKISAVWKPYRTLACMYIWRFRDEHLKNTKAR